MSLSLSKNVFGCDVGLRARDRVASPFAHMSSLRNDYLEQKKKYFPRFYFVANGALLDILSNGNKPLKVGRRDARGKQSENNKDNRDNLTSPIPELRLVCMWPHVDEVALHSAASNT